MGAFEDFLSQLTALGFKPRALPGNRVAFDYAIELGSRRGQQIQLGFTVPPDFPTTPPGGPLVSPPLGHPGGAFQAVADLEGQWEYWSRPFPNWQGGNRTVRAYMAHIRHLFQLS